MDAQVHRLLPETAPPDLEIWLPGDVHGKGRPRTRIMKTRDGRQFAHHYTDAQTRSYEAQLKYAAEQAMDGRRQIDEAMRCRVTAIFAIPASFSKQKRALALDGSLRHIVKPDGDNLLKCVGDGLNKVVWTDDCRVAEWAIRKFFGLQPGLFIEIWCMGGSML
jgi:Holliday junction resolvase RusA-like endonuclease